MSNPPQAKTLRYLRNLLADGENTEFRIQYVTRESAVVDDVPVGIFYRVEMNYHHEARFDASVKGIGSSPVNALKNACVKTGGTFRDV